MTITGRVLHIRETWPLQFVVATGQQRCDVSLRDDTRVVRQGVQVDPGELQPGSTIEVSGDGDESGMTANVVVIL